MIYDLANVEQRRNKRSEMCVNSGRVAARCVRVSCGGKLMKTKMWIEIKIRCEKKKK